MTDPAIRLNMTRTMVAYITALRANDQETARTILGVTVKSNEDLAAFVEALTEFALGMIKTTEGIAAAFGGEFDTTALLDKMTSDLAGMNDLAGVNYHSEADGTYHD